MASGRSQKWRQHSWNPQISRGSVSKPLSLFFRLSLGQAGVDPQSPGSDWAELGETEVQGAGKAT